ncbi:MAG: Rhamnogalacturonyl hydrolase YesR [Chthonomonadaceae bacterium]|nr:Rhamnogalacturonyl hydrolase YesR [Chthonomonadaceae bacterium]
MTIPLFLHPVIMAITAIGLFASPNTLLPVQAQSRRGGQGDPVVAKAERATLAMQRFSWEQGVVAQAFLESGDEEMVVMLARGSLLNQTQDGRVAAVGGAPIDPLMCGEAMWHAAEVTHDPDLRKAADNLLEYALKRAQRATDGTLFHTGHTMWSDSLHTAPPFLAISGHYDEAVQQIEGYRKRLWDPNKRLFAHIWDEDKQTFPDKGFWGGGNGWAAVALTRIIRASPAAKQADKERLTGYLRELLDGCLAHQRPDGFFYNYVDQPDTFVEVNLGQMLAFSIYEGVRGGWLPRSYLEAANRVRKAAHARVDRYGLVQGVAGAPGFNHPGVSPEGQAFFLMMEAAAKKLDKRR